MTDRREIRSTSRASAECSDITLRENETTRLVFRPQLVENPNDSAAAVHGKLLYQRKGGSEEWQDTESIALSTLKKGEGVQLELKSAEVLTLFRELDALYRLHARDGIQFGKSELVRADSVMVQLSSLPAKELRSFLSAHSNVGFDLLGKLLGWAAQLSEPDALLSRLLELESPALRELSAAIGLESLKRALSIWDQHADSSDEEFWQSTLTEHSFVLEQVFDWPSTIVKGKAYLGGKSVLNAGGNVVDFLVKNYFTNSAALVEIKTPATPLLGGEYRGGVFNPSKDLSGSVMQVLNYKFSLKREFYSLQHGLPGGLEAFEPKCVVIVGNTDELADVPAKVRSLELYRSHASGVAIITFNELFERTRRLVQVLEASNAS